MLNPFISMFLVNNSYMDPEYNNLSAEEKANLRFVDSCLFNEDKRISDASFYMTMLLIEISAEPDKYSPEEIQAKKEEICTLLNDEESVMMDKFLLASIQTMGILSEESKKQRRLLMEEKGRENNE